MKQQNSPNRVSNPLMHNSDNGPIQNILLYFSFSVSGGVWQDGGKLNIKF